MTGVAPGLQNQCGEAILCWVGSIPTRSRHIGFQNKNKKKEENIFGVLPLFITNTYSIL